MSGRLAALAAEIRAHSGCGLELCAGCTQLVPGDGPADAAVAFVGEAPGAAEDEAGRPFVGRAGRLLDDLLAEAGLERASVYVTNVVKARPPGNRDPRRGEVAHHLPWLLAELDLVRPRAVVTLGRHALAHLAPDLRIAEAHGVPVIRNGRTLVPWYHPAAALHNPALLETLRSDARGLTEFLQYPTWVPTMKS